MLHLNYTKELKYLHHMARTTVQSTFQIERHPECWSDPKHYQILQTGQNRFYRNLGGRYLKHFHLFLCSCNSKNSWRLVKKGPFGRSRKRCFIDPHTKIVSHHVSKTPCILGLPPAIRSMEGDYVTDLPDRQALHPFDATALNLTQDSTSKELYKTLVAEYIFRTTFLCHFLCHNF